MEVMEFIKRIGEMIVGLVYWSYLVRSVQEVGNTAIILIPNSAKEDENYAIDLVETLIKQKEYDNAFLLLGNQIKRIESIEIEHNPKIFSSRINQLFENGLKQFYLYKDFDSRFYYASLCEPFRRNGHYLIGVHGMDRREIFARGVYGIAIENGTNIR